MESKTNWNSLTFAVFGAFLVITQHYEPAIWSAIMAVYWEVKSGK